MTNEEFDDYEFIINDDDLEINELEFIDDEDQEPVY